MIKPIPIDPIPFGMVSSGTSANPPNMMRKNPQAMLSMRLTASIGAAGMGREDEPGDLLARAEAALGEAKSRGRDRVVVRAP